MAMANSHTHNQTRQRANYKIPIMHVHSLTAGGQFAGDSNPERFIGQWGSISIDFINQCVRVHDDVTPGGCAKVPMFAPGSAVAWPFTPLEWGPISLVVPVGGTASQTFTHNFGRFAVVRVIDAITGDELEVDIVHTLDKLSFTITVAVSGSYIVYAQ
jgi:hypothetical protein